MVLGLAVCCSAQADESTSVPTRPDPFEKLNTLESGRIASTWSSLPSGEGCVPGQKMLAGHGMLLADVSDNGQESPQGPFSLVQPRHRLQLDATGQLGCVFGQVALQRQVDPAGDYWSWDGTAISWRIDEHWRLGAGRIARQWGPAWDGSLILSTAARPIPSLDIEAASGPLDKDGWWWWLGEVNFSGFLGQLEDDRGDYDRPYLMGARLVVRPWPWLELGASRTAMWGGEGRSNSFKAFLKSILGRDNSCYQPGCSEQPGNQLGGYDARLSLDSWLPGAALYGQMIGEDSRPDDIPVPAKNMYQAGAEWRRDGAMAFVEWTDSSAEFAGVAYNHFLYTDGYRYKGQPLGYWADGDSNLWTVGGLLRDLFGGQALAVVRYGTLNESGAKSSWPTSRLSSASLQWRRLFDRVFGLTLALDHVDLSRTGTGAADASWRDTQFRVQFDAWLY